MNSEKICKKLRGIGLRITPLKKQVINLFLSGACGLSAGDVFNRLTCKSHISSVHRCLDSLEKAGFLRPDRNSEGVLLYRCARSFYPDHGHFRCGECGRRFPVAFSLPDEFIKRIENTGNFKIVNSDFVLEGICLTCSEE